MPDLETEVVVLPARPADLSICTKCLLNCYWQDCPTGGWWRHEWPNKAYEKAIKSDPRKEHDADPGWQPTPEDEETSVHA